MRSVLSVQEQEYILSSYQSRKATIRELANKLNKNYTTIRMHLVSNGYSNGKKVR